MKCWSAISEEEYKTLMETGKLVCDPVRNNVLANRFYKEKICYDWISEKLRQKCPSDIQYPRWVFTSISGSTNEFSVNKCFYWTRGTFYLVVLDIPEARLLLSDYDLWLHCMNNWNINRTEQESDQWDEYIKLTGLTDIDTFVPDYIQSLNQEQQVKLKDIQNKIIESWDNIFDITAQANDWCFSENKTIQGITWELLKTDIQQVHCLHISKQEQWVFSGKWEKRRTLLEDRKNKYKKKQEKQKRTFRVKRKW